MLVNLLRLQISETLEEHLDVHFGQYVGKKIERNMGKSEVQLEFRSENSNIAFTGYLIDKVNNDINIIYNINGIIKSNRETNVLTVEVSIPIEIVYAMILMCVVSCIGFLSFYRRSSSLNSMFFIILPLITVLFSAIIIFNKLFKINEIIIDFIQSVS